MLSSIEKNRLIRLNQQLFSIVRDIRILRHLSWPAQAKLTFFANKARELPQVEYPQYDASSTLKKLQDVKSQLQSTVYDDWLAKQVATAENTALLLASCGSDNFYRYSTQLFGTPKDTLLDGSSTALSLAEKFNDLLSGFSSLPDSTSEPDRSADYAAQVIATGAQDLFGDQAPQLSVVDELSANALAGAKRIRLRRSASFSDRDIQQLIQHEAYIHVATALNGRQQNSLPVLGCSHAGTTRTQEGLAVFAEFITGTLDLDRMRRLSDRMIAIQMSVEGADFLQVYQYFLEQTQGNEDQSYENSRRVFRGGVLTGGAPFTKDIVYLDGLVRVHNFLRSAVAANRADCIQLLFCGKLDLDDIPVLGQLHTEGLCNNPRYLPPWVSDMQFLLCYLAYSSFLNGIDLQKVKTHYEALLNATPVIHGSVDW